MQFRFFKKTAFKLLIISIFFGLFALVYCLKDRIPLIEILSDKQLLMSEIESYGMYAPFVFILVQAAQVLLAPIPGEISGLAGGYIFGALKGFFISSFALTLGSVINFVLARYAGRDIVRKILPEKYFRNFDRFFEEEGKVFVFALFLFPGFPKDYFCLFLGITNIRFSVFLLFTFLGRMPGTLLLSIQGEMLYDGEYLFTAVLAAVTGIISFLLIFYRKKIYHKFRKPR
jgi:uncharacterized membrane protein YdjX (TVP38/TMEM64 family)